MAVDYLAVPTKATGEAELVKPLKTFIKENFAEIKAEDYEKPLVEFNRLRAQAASKFNDKHESAVEAVSRYYDQFVALEKKIPFTEDQARVNFTWYDAFTKASLLTIRPKLSIALGSFEKACILFNIAALQSQVASVQSRDSDEGLKLSAKLFQQSSGIFKYLKENIMSMLGRDPTPDLHPDTLSALSALMLAQAQESIYQKGAIDKMKDAIVAKIAMECSFCYAEALKLLQLYSVKDVWPKEWIVTVAGKQAAFHALAEYYQSGVACSTKAYGEELARLQHAKELTQAAITRASKEVDFSAQLCKIDTALQKAKKDNDFIYHDKVPDYKSLPSVGRASVAKSLPIPEQMSNNFKDMFEKLVPLAVHAAVVSFESKRGQLVNTEIGRLREATQTMNAILSSMNLPAAIEDVSGTEVPSSVLEKANKIQELGGVSILNQLISDLPELLTRNKQILDEGFRMMDEEENSDRQLREQFGDKWNRTPSAKLTEGIRTEGAKYNSIISNAVQADSIIKEKYNKHKQGFELLSLPAAELKKKLPTASSLGALKDSSEVKQLRALMQQVDSVKAERESLENELKNKKCDMLNRFVSALAADGAIDESSLSAVELQTIYGSLTQQINDSLSKQEQIMAQVKIAHESFARAKSSDQSAFKRDELLRELAAAYDAFVELKGNLEEGTKFYNDLTQILLKYQNKISDLCFARKTEKDELMKDLNQQIASQPAQSVPQTPTYQNPNPQPASAPPKRPPPPPPKTTPTQSDAQTSHVAVPQPTLPTQVTPAAPTAPPAVTAPNTQMPSSSQVPPSSQAPPNPQMPYQGYMPSPFPYYAQMPTMYNPYGYGGGYYAGQPGPGAYNMPQQPQYGQPGYPQGSAPGQPYPTQPVNYPGGYPGYPQGYPAQYGPR